MKDGENKKERLTTWQEKIRKRIEIKDNEKQLKLDVKDGRERERRIGYMPPKERGDRRIKKGTCVSNSKSRMIANSGGRWNGKGTVGEKQEAKDSQEWDRWRQDELRVN